MTTAVHPLTVEEFMNLPDPAEGRLELVAGQVVCMPGPRPEHGVLAGRIHAFIGAFVYHHGLGEIVAPAAFHVRSDPNWVPIPDVAFISKDRLGSLDQGRSTFEGAPDLAIEVISPSNSAQLMRDKVTAYFDGGAQRVWLVFPSGIVEVHRPDWVTRILRTGDVLISDDAAFAVPGFELRIDDIFAGIRAPRITDD